MSGEMKTDPLFTRAEGSRTDAELAHTQQLSRLSFWLTPGLILSGLFTFYCAMFLRYRPYEVDNPWFLSFSYNSCVEHFYSDYFMETPFPLGMDGTKLFGKLAAYTQYAAVGPFGWQQRPAAVLSACLIVFALAMWWIQLRKLRFSRTFAACFLIFAGLSEPFLGAATRFRYEFLSFALISAGLVLVSYGKPLFGIFLAALAVEVQPAGVLGLIPIVILAFSSLSNSGSRSRRNLLAQLAGGLSLAALAYCALHPDIIHLRTYLLQMRSLPGDFDGGTFKAYFIARKRHLPELIFFVFAGVCYVLRRGSLASHYIAGSALALTLMVAAMPHGNPAYIIFVYPFLVAMAMLAFRAERRPWIAIVCVLLYLLPQQLYLVYKTRNLGYRTSDIAQISRAIQQSANSIGMPDSTLRIYGDYRLYFAHPHFYRSASTNTLRDITDGDLYLCFNKPPQPVELEAGYVLYCPDLRNAIPLRPVNELTLRGEEIFFYVRK